MATLTWYGHSAFKIETDDCAIMIDPYFAPGCGFSWQDAGKIDVVLVTHDHGDHVGSAIDICCKYGSRLGCVVGTAQALIDRGVPQDQVLNGIGFNIGGTLQIGNIGITMVQAFHSSDTAVPVGYLVNIPGSPVLYHAGDTGIFESMKLFGSLYKIGLALLPVGGVFTMDGYQAAHACKLIGCPAVVPMHWGTFPMLAQNLDGFRNALASVCPDCSCLEMKRGESRKF